MARSYLKIGRAGRETGEMGDGVMEKRIAWEMTNLMWGAFLSSKEFSNRIFIFNRYRIETKIIVVVNG